MPPSRRRRLLLALALCAGGWTVAATPAGAAPAGSAPTSAPAPSAPTIASTTSTTTPRSTPPAPEEPFEPADAIDWVKDHLVLVIGGVGVVLLIALWKFVSRGPSRKF